EGVAPVGAAVIGAEQADARGPQAIGIQRIHQQSEIVSALASEIGPCGRAAETASEAVSRVKAENRGVQPGGVLIRSPSLPGARLRRHVEAAVGGAAGQRGGGSAIRRRKRQPPGGAAIQADPYAGVSRRINVR